MIDFSCIEKEEKWRKRMKLAKRSKRKKKQEQTSFKLFLEGELEVGKSYLMM
jgi:hypothetical protein